MRHWNELNSPISFLILISLTEETNGHGSLILLLQYKVFIYFPLLMHTSPTVLYNKLWSWPCPKRVKFLISEISNFCLNKMDRLQRRCPWINISPSWCSLCHTNKSSLIDPQQLERFGQYLLLPSTRLLLAIMIHRAGFTYCLVGHPWKLTKNICGLALFVCSVEDMRWKEWWNLPGQEQDDKGHNQHSFIVPFLVDCI